MAKKKKKLSKSGRVLLDAILVVSLCVAVFSGWKIYSELHQYKANDQKYEDLRAAVTVSTPTPSASASADTSLVNDNIDWSALQAMNSDVAGWIRQPDTPIDYPVVYGSDNSYYLRHTLDGEYSIFGTIFVDYQNNRGFVDKNTVIYGHHFSHYDDTMLTTLDYYNDQSYYDAHPYLEFLTPETDYLLYPIAGVVKQGTDAYIRTSFADDDDYAAYVQNFLDNSTFKSNETFSPSDQTVLISSCSDLVQDGRYALLCKLVKAD